MFTLRTLEDTFTSDDSTFLRGCAAQTVVVVVGLQKRVTDCRSRGHEFVPGLVPYFHGDLIMK